MPINRGVFGVLALACIVAAGGGAYLATRQNQAAVTATTVSPGALSETQPVSGAPSTVTETETIIEDVPKDAPNLAEPVEAPVMRPAATRSSAPRQPRTTTRPTSSAGSSRNSRADAGSAPAPVERGNFPEPVAPPPPIAELPPVFAPAPIESSLPPLPEKTLLELKVPADSVLGLQIDTALTSEKAKIEDKVNARVTRDVTVGSEVAIPAGSRVEGSVTLVEKGGKVKERARLGIRFHTLVLADGTRMPLSTETVFRDGTPPAKESTAKIGGAAVGGAILGAILGGGKGATIGGAVGAAGGTAAVMAGDRNAATLPAGSTVTVRILSPVTVTVEQ
jgi:hypothetical protein